ncbi:MAG: hypothetical protein M1814_003077 [Vezdaea aestivalis]|nr:MAG: hypothetical protein M1814_003077 [Vezdaea aestivalis]
MAVVMQNPLDMGLDLTHTASSSPSASSVVANSAAAGSSSSAPRRPPRKSTLTQQQKNQKRQRATQDQLGTLEVEFNKNPTPTAVVRERIAQEIEMTERSVQIWFQNRRAKIKLLAKKSIETGEDCDAIPESMRNYLAMQAIESGKPLGQRFLGRAGINPYGSGALFNGEPSNSSKVVIQHFTCRSLSIGSWRRVGQNTMDLVVFYSPDKACITYYINNDSAGYKIEYPFAYIKNLSMEFGDPSSEDPINGQRMGGLVVELNRPPNFFMDAQGSGGFYQCGDFTEDQQASQVMVHHLGGNPKVLTGQLAKLTCLETFQNRHGLHFDHQIIAASAPVSPIGHRPASQPNQMGRNHMGMFQESQFGMTLQPPRGHKRTRSRSVPAAIDFSMLHQPMPSFTFQQEPATQMADPNIFAPVPQHTANLGTHGSNLRIDTSSAYGMDFRQYPMSAATTNSPSEYASPGFFSTGAQVETMAASTFNPNYSLPFLSPMVDPTNMVGPSISPLSAMSHNDPVIANQSPPLSNMHRSASAEMFQLSHDTSNMSDDGLNLSDLYSKQTLTLPIHSPGMDGSADDLDLHNLVSFGSLDAASLSPENHNI